MSKRKQSRRKRNALGKRKARNGATTTRPSCEIRPSVIKQEGRPGAKAIVSTSLASKARKEISRRDKGGVKVQYLTQKEEYALIDNATLNAIEIKITKPTGVDLEKVKAIALYEESEGGARYAYIIKNVEKTPTEQRLKSWWLVPVFSD